LRSPPILSSWVLTTPSSMPRFPVLRVQMVEHLLCLFCPNCSIIFLGFSLVQEGNRSRRNKKKLSKANQPTGHTNNKVTCALPPILSSPVVKCVYSASTELYVCSHKNQWNEDYEETRARYKNKNEKMLCLCLRL
jgi:hypothetical protein